VTALAIRRPSRAWPRRAVLETLGGLSVAALAVGLTVIQQSTHRFVDAVAAIVVVGGSIWFASTRRVEFALALMMLYLGLLDGYLKLSTGSNYVTFVRDALLYALAFGVLLRAGAEGRRLKLAPLGVWVIAFVVVVFAQLANPDRGSLYHSLAGLRQDLEFVPLFFLTYTYVRSVKALRAFVLILVVVGAVNGIVDVVQFNESPSQLASWGPGYNERVLGTQEFGEAGRTFYTSSGQQLTRPFGLGSDSGDGGFMGAFAIGGILALVALNRRRRYLFLAAPAAACAVAGVVTAQSRAVILAAVIMAVGYFILTAASRRALRTIIAATVTAAIVFVAVTTVLHSSSQSSDLRYSNLSASNLIQTLNQNRGFSLARIPKYFVDYPVGAGLGVGGPAQGVKGAPAGAGVLDSENEFNYLIIETGVPGLIALLAFTLSVIVIGLRRCRRVEDRETRVLLAAIIAPVIGMLALFLGTAVTPTTPCGPYLWAAGGVVAYWLITKPADRELAENVSSGARAYT
jgi:hypothetical protein